jgi:excisionase family DNA binding protein
MMELLSTSEAARVIGVGTTSVKRWADTGLLDCVRTAGGHRRFTRTALDRFVRLQRHADPIVDGVDLWLDVLLSEMSHELALVRARGRLGSWCAVAEELAPALTELGLRWRRGEVSVDEEHATSERLSRALARIVESLPLSSKAPLCLLACVECEEHSLGLSLAELCFRELGWATLWLGRRTPMSAIVRQVRVDDRIRMVGLSASEACMDQAVLRRVNSAVGSACRDRNVALILGGRGLWPDVPGYGIRLREFHEIEALQRQLFKTSRRRAAR